MQELNDEAISDAINAITAKLSDVFLQEFLQLPKALQINLILIKSAQLLLANVLCQVASDNYELNKIIEEQGVEMQELTLDCAYTGFASKFAVEKH